MCAQVAGELVKLIADGDFEAFCTKVKDVKDLNRRDKNGVCFSFIKVS